jgi:hypothetical protein
MSSSVVAGPHVLGVLSGPQADPDASLRDVPTVLVALAAQGCSATVITVDPVSAGLLATIGVVPSELPDELLAGAIEVPAACGPALPVLSMWPIEAVTAPEAWAARRAASPTTGIQEWRLRVESAAYSAHRSSPVALAVCGSGPSAGRAVALMLAAESDVAVLVLLDDVAVVDGAALAVLDACTEAWARDDRDAARWRAAAPDCAARVAVVDVSDPGALAAAARATAHRLVAART